MAAPLALFVVDRFVARRPLETIATEVDVLPSGVTKLTLVQPTGFDHAAGDYVFVRVPELARGEWHPFTISSAPERKDAFTLHVRSAATGRAPCTRSPRPARRTAPPLSVSVTGPTARRATGSSTPGTCCSWRRGSGSTPFASVLASMRERIERDRELGVQKVCFVWLCREQRSFEWFSDVLGRLEQLAPDRVDVRIYLDAGDRDLKSSVLRVAMDSLYASVRADLVTGLRARTTLGAPEWDALVEELVEAHAPTASTASTAGPRAWRRWCGTPAHGTGAVPARALLRRSHGARGAQDARLFRKSVDRYQMTTDRMVMMTGMPASIARSTLSVFELRGWASIDFSPRRQSVPQVRRGRHRCARAHPSRAAAASVVDLEQHDGDVVLAAVLVGEIHEVVRRRVDVAVLLLDALEDVVVAHHAAEPVGAEHVDVADLGLLGTRSTTTESCMRAPA